MGQLDGFYQTLSKAEEEAVEKPPTQKLNLNSSWHPRLRICCNCGHIAIPVALNTLRCTRCGCSRPNLVKHVSYINLLYKYGNKEVKQTIRDFKNNGK